MLLAEPLTDRGIGSLVEVHWHTGPEPLESVYDLCLCRELADTGIALARQVTFPVLYNGAESGDGFKADIVFAGEPILKIEVVSTILPIRSQGPWRGLPGQGNRINSVRDKSEG
jgi:GxxExxY protein